MRRLVMMLVAILPLMAYAQVWELPEDQQPQQKPKVTKEKSTGDLVAEADPDAMYLAGAVPESEGKVVWERTYHNSWDASTNYDKMLEYLSKLTKESNQLSGSRIALVDKQDHNIVATVSEWLVFKSSFISLDQTEFDYTILAECRDNQVHVKIFRLRYKYEEHRDGGEFYYAEDIISDTKALNKSKTKLIKKIGKFRRKTVDRMEWLLADISEKLRSDD